MSKQKINWWTGKGLLWGFDQPQVNYNAPSYVTDPNYTQATNNLMPFASFLM